MFEKSLTPYVVFSLNNYKINNLEVMLESKLRIFELPSVTLVMMMVEWETIIDKYYGDVSFRKGMVTFARNYLKLLPLSSY